MAIRILTLNNLNQDITYINKVMSLVERTQTANAAPYLYPHNRDFFERNLNGETINILALDADNVVGYAALRPMNPWPNYLERYEYPPEECALMLFVLVDPSYRKKRIGKRLSEARLASAKKAGFRHLFVTVHPDNKPSIHVLEGLGFSLIEQKPMFTNKLIRNLMYVDLQG